MSSVAHERLRNLIIRHLSLILQRELNDGYFQEVTVIDAEVSRDKSYCKVFVTCGLKHRPKLIVEQLNVASGKIRQHLSRYLQIYQTPKLTFVYDDTQEKAARIEELLRSNPSNES